MPSFATNAKVKGI